MCYKKYMIGSRAIIWVGLLLCLLLLSPSLQAESLDLSTLSTEELLEMYQQNSTERDVLSRELQNTLNIVQNQLQLSLETSDQARQQATEAWMESQKAVISANESKNSIVKTTQSYLNWQDEVNNQMKELKTQNFWLKAGMFAAMTLAAGGLFLAMSR